MRTSGVRLSARVSVLADFDSFEVMWVVDERLESCQSPVEIKNRIGDRGRSTFVFGLNLDGSINSSSSRHRE